MIRLVARGDVAAALLDTLNEVGKSAQDEGEPKAAIMVEARNVAFDREIDHLNSLSADPETRFHGRRAVQYGWRLYEVTYIRGGMIARLRTRMARAAQVYLFETLAEYEAWWRGEGQYAVSSKPKPPKTDATQVI